MPRRKPVYDDPIPLQAQCTWCGMGIGKPCKDPDGELHQDLVANKWRRKSHKERMELVKIAPGKGRDLLAQILAKGEGVLLQEEMHWLSVEFPGVYGSTAAHLKLESAGKLWQAVEQGLVFCGDVVLPPEALTGSVGQSDGKR